MNRLTHLLHDAMMWAQLSYALHIRAVVQQSFFMPTGRKAGGNHPINALGGANERGGRLSPGVTLISAPKGVSVLLAVCRPHHATAVRKAVMPVSVTNGRLPFRFGGGK